MTSKSRLRLATETCTIKRVIVDSAGETDLPVSYLTDVPCTPIVSRQTGYIEPARKQDGTSAMVIQKETFVFGDYDITKGMVLSNGGKDYAICDVHRYSTFQDPFAIVVLEDVQANKEPDSEFMR